MQGSGRAGIGRRQVDGRRHRDVGDAALVADDVTDADYRIVQRAERHPGGVESAVWGAVCPRSFRVLAKLLRDCVNPIEIGSDDIRVNIVGVTVSRNVDGIRAIEYTIGKQPIKRSIFCPP